MGVYCGQEDNPGFGFSHGNPDIRIVCKRTLDTIFGTKKFDQMTPNKQV